MSIDGARYHETRRRVPSGARAHHLALGLVALTACVDTLSIPLPPIDPSIRTVVLVASRPRGATLEPFFAEAFVLPAALTWPRALPTDVHLTALYYPETIAALGLSAGRLTLADATTRTPRPLPDARERWGLSLPGAATWRALTPSELPPVAIPGFEPEECITRTGACWSRSACVIPCPDAAPIAAPIPPVLPAAPLDGACPEGWSTRAPTELGAVICAPDALDVTCPTGQVSTSGAACRPVGPTCPMGQYPELSTSRPVIWVLPGALGGDGSLTAPAGTLDEALALAPDGAVVALARGSYATTATITGRRDLAITGACAAETVIDGALWFEESHGVALSGIKLHGPERSAALTFGASTASLDGVWIDGRRAGLDADTSTITVVDALFTGPDGVVGDAAIRTSTGAVLTLDAVSI
ncbi:hypothetical protein L6R52_41275, partial [Myxococcota bacterium]|nr:hypothetical protein [Myxococcota bacterium]